MNYYDHNHHPLGVASYWQHQHADEEITLQILLLIFYYSQGESDRWARGGVGEED